MTYSFATGLVAMALALGAVPASGQASAAEAAKPDIKPPVPLLADPLLADPLMAERMRSIPKVRPWPIAWFQPQEKIAGRALPRTVPIATGRSIDRQALSRASEYARSRQTQALFIWRKGKLELAEFGEGTSPTDFVNSYYLHFPVLQMLFGIAIQEGRIHSIDDPVERYLPEWAGQPRGKVTLRQMLTMSAGLEMYHDSSDPKSKAGRLFFGSDSTTAALEYQAIEEPGKNFAYNYLIPELLGIVLERAVKTRYSEYLSSRLWKPLGNADAVVWLDRPGGRPHYNSAIFATAEDWLNVGKLILANGRVGKRQVVPAEWIALMKEPGASPNYGMLWLGTSYVPVRSLAPDVAYKVNSSAPYLADDLIFLDGYGGQRVYIVPSEDLVIVRIGYTRKDWDDAILPNIILAGIKR